VDFKWILSGFLRGFLRNILGELSWNILGTFSEYSWGTFLEYSRNFLGIFLGGVGGDF